MLAAVLPQARGAVEVREVNLAAPGPGEVLVRMEACGICHSDLFIGGLEKLPHAPVILGHEGIGRVEAVGEGVNGWAVGDRAGTTFLGSTCGGCEWCADGRERFCPKQTNFGYTADGAMAEYLVAPANTLVRVPSDLNATEIAPLCCAGWTAAGAVREAGLAPGQLLALFGYGGLGHLALQIALSRGLRVAVSDVSPEKMEAARTAGAEPVAKGSSDAAIVFTAAAAAIPQAFRAIKRTGTLILVGLSTSQYELPLVDTVLRGITIRGSYLGTRQDLDEVFHLARRGALRPSVEVHPLSEAPALLDRLRRGEISGRAVIAF
jgi:alcohol dehydrogenase, propanol-preferring